MFIVIFQNPVSHMNFKLIFFSCLHSFIYYFIFNFKGNSPTVSLFYFPFFSCSNVLPVIWHLKSFLKTWCGSDCFWDVSGRKEGNRRHPHHGMKTISFLYVVSPALLPTPSPFHTCHPGFLSLVPQHLHCKVPCSCGLRGGRWGWLLMEHYKWKGSQNLI